MSAKREEAPESITVTKRVSRIGGRFFTGVTRGKKMTFLSVLWQG
jgi:hypothetical protein